MSLLQVLHQPFQGPTLSAAACSPRREVLQAKVVQAAHAARAVEPVGHQNCRSPDPAAQVCPWRFEARHRDSQGPSCASEPLKSLLSLSGRLAGDLPCVPLAPPASGAVLWGLSAECTTLSAVPLGRLGWSRIIVVWRWAVVAPYPK